MNIENTGNHRKRLPVFFILINIRIEVSSADGFCQL